VEHLKILKRVAAYLAAFGWDVINVGIALWKFEETHGVEKVRAMGRFIDWSEENGREDGWIAAQLGHDLNGCEETAMSPRTGGY
jgi:hypothetical protein